VTGPRRQRALQARVEVVVDAGEKLSRDRTTSIGPDLLSTQAA
jgi:hypothetical protein